MKQPDGYVQIVQNCGVHITVKCEVCGMNYVPEEGKNCPGCRIKDERPNEDFSI
jgi:hypothetical protein